MSYHTCVTLLLPNVVRNKKVLCNSHYSVSSLHHIRLCTHYSMHCYAPTITIIMHTSYPLLCTHHSHCYALIISIIVMHQTVTFLTHRPTD